MARDNKKYGPDSRSEMEKDEGGKIDTGMPKGRMQTEVQVNTGEENVLKADEQLSVVANVEKKVRDRIKVRPESENVPQKNNPEIAGFSKADSPLGYAAAGFGSVTVEDASRIPYNKGGNRPSQGFGRKLSDDDFIIDNAVCEQIDPEFTDMTPISEAADKTMFYSGRKKFTKERGKKRGGTTPQSLLYDRSVDFEYCDETIHTTGQVLADINETVSVLPNDDGEEQSRVKAGYPMFRALPNADYGEASGGGYENVPIPMRKSNYVLKSFKFTITNTEGFKHVSGIGFNEDECVASSSTLGKEQCNLNWEVDRNNVAKSVIDLQTKLGRETTNEWSGLGYATLETYEYNMLLHDIEATTGAIMGTAYRAANSSLAFCQGLKLRKDGARSQDPAVDMFVNGFCDTINSQQAVEILQQANSFQDAIFNVGQYKAGSAAAIIAMFDTVGKYKTKASFFNYQKSLKYFVQKMDNNIEVFHAKKDFLMTLDTAHKFSTVDGSYNPMLPVFATKNISLVNPLSLNAFAKGFKREKWGVQNDANYTQAGTFKNYALKWTDIRMAYRYGVTHPIVDGLADWLVLNEQALVRVFAPDLSEGKSVTIEIPATFNMLYPSLFTWFLAAASQRIAYNRQLAMVPVLQASDQIGYIYPDLAPLGELNFKFSSQLNLVDYKTPLGIGKLKSAAAVRTMWPEAFSACGVDNPTVGTSAIALQMPWYFNEQGVSQSFDPDFSHWIEERTPAVMSYPSVRHGVRHEYIDLLYSLSPRDVRLSMDRIVELPIPVRVIEPSAAGPGFSYVDGKVYVPDISAASGTTNMVPYALRYDKQSDGRVIVSYDNSVSGTKSVLTKAAIMCCPRELGLMYGNFRVTPILEQFSYNGREIGFNWDGMYRLSSVLDGSTSFRLVSYSAFGPEADTGVVIDESSALSQRYCVYFSDRTDTGSAANAAYIAETGMCPSTTYLFAQEGTPGKALGAIVSQTPLYPINGLQPVTDGETKTNVFTSFVPVVWTMLNRTFRPIDVYQNCVGDSIPNDPSPNEQQPPVGYVPFDNMENSFYFGLCGFLAADYQQDVLERAEEYQQLNMFYVKDAFVRDSLITRAD